MIVISSKERNAFDVLPELPQCEYRYRIHAHVYLAVAHRTEHAPESTVDADTTDLVRADVAKNVNFWHRVQLLENDLEDLAAATGVPIQARFARVDVHVRFHLNRVQPDGILIYIGSFIEIQILAQLSPV